MFQSLRIPSRDVYIEASDRVFGLMTRVTLLLIRIVSSEDFKVAVWIPPVIFGFRFPKPVRSCGSSTGESSRSDRLLNWSLLWARLAAPGSCVDVYGPLNLRRFVHRQFRRSRSYFYVVARKNIICLFLNAFDSFWLLCNNSDLFQFLMQTSWVFGTGLN